MQQDQFFNQLFRQAEKYSLEDFTGQLPWPKGQGL